MRIPQAPQYPEELRGLPSLLTQLPGPAVGVSYFWSRLALGGGEGLPEGDLHVQLTSGALSSVWQGLEHLQPFREVTDGFHIGRARAGALSRALPVGDGLGTQARLGVVMRQQFGLRLGGLGKARLQHMHNTLVELLPRALE